jgi:hypothetical protein
LNAPDYLFYVTFAVVAMVLLISLAAWFERRQKGD